MLTPLTKWPPDKPSAHLTPGTTTAILLCSPCCSLPLCDCFYTRWFVLPNPFTFLPTPQPSSETPVKLSVLGGQRVHRTPVLRDTSRLLGQMPPIPAPCQGVLQWQQPRAHVHATETPLLATAPGPPGSGQGSFSPPPIIAQGWFFLEGYSQEPWQPLWPTWSFQRVAQRNMLFLAGNGFIISFFLPCQIGILRA